MPGADRSDFYGEAVLIKPFAAISLAEKLPLLSMISIFCRTESLFSDRPAVGANTG
jgi:hypothetical protein